MPKNKIVSRTVAKDARKFYAGKLASASGHPASILPQALAIGYAQGRKKSGRTPQEINFPKSYWGC